MCWKKGNQLDLKKIRLGSFWDFPGVYGSFLPVKAIQTGLEGNDGAASLTKLAGGGCPHTCPFAIVEDMGISHEDSIYDIRHMVKGRKGPFIFAEMI